MSAFARLFGRKTEPKKRIRVCIECGMPLLEHKDWCAILRGQQEAAERSAAAGSTTGS
jgi:hypothetical protein